MCSAGLDSVTHKQLLHLLIGQAGGSAASDPPSPSRSRSRSPPPGGSFLHESEINAALSNLTQALLTSGNGSTGEKGGTDEEL